MEKLNEKTIELIKQNQALLNKKLKGWIEKEAKSTVPSLSEFLHHGSSVLIKLKKDPTNYEFSISEKYQSWIENDWKDGNNKEIKNWKSKLNRVIPYLKAVYPDRQFGNQQSPRSGKQLVLIGERLNHNNDVQEAQFSYVE